MARREQTDVRAGAQAGWRWNWAIRLLGAVGAGLLLYLATSLHPQWWAGWVAPALLLLVAYRAGSNLEALGLAWLAALIGTVDLFGYISFYTSHVWAVVILVAVMLLWGVAVVQSRRAVQAWGRAPAVFVFPCFWAAFDTLITFLSPEGNSGSLAHNQARARAVIQIGALLGNAGIVFEVALGASLAALALDTVLFARGSRAGARKLSAMAVAAGVLAAALGFGFARARHASGSGQIVAAMLSMDQDGVQWDGPDHGVASTDKVWETYEAWVPYVAHAGVNLIMLPEKVAPVYASTLPGVEQRLGSLARISHAYLEVGLAVRYDGYWENRALLFTPTGLLTGDYSKQHPVPIVESDYHAGNQFVVSGVMGVPVGLAICKDLDFPAVGRQYGQEGIQVLLQPAWDAGRDGWWRAQTAILTGVEDGYTVLHDSREGWLTMSDAYGNLAESQSSATPGPHHAVTVSASYVPLGSGQPTLYARYGDWFGWLCVLFSLLFLRFASYRPRRGSVDRSSRPLVAAVK